MTANPYKLQLSKGFFVDFTQVARVLGHAIQHQDEGRIAQKSYANSIGVSISRAKNLCSLATAFELIQPITLTPTNLGVIVHRHDPFFDDLGTLWLLHYLVGSNERYVVWNRLTNRMIPAEDQFSTASARSYFDDLSQFYSEHSMDKHLRKEIGAVWNAYTEQAFRYLSYIRAESDLIYAPGNPKRVPPRIFWAAVLTYRERFAPEVATLDVLTVASESNSPGRVFNLRERQVRDLLEKVERLGYAYVETRADLDQVRFRENGFLDVVRDYYETR